MANDDKYPPSPIEGTQEYNDKTNKRYSGEILQGKDHEIKSSDSGNLSKIENTDKIVISEDYDKTDNGGGNNAECSESGLVVDEDDSSEAMEENFDPNDPDQADILKLKKLKKLVICTVNKLKPKDEDTLPYGIAFESEEFTSEHTTYEVSGNTIVSNQSFRLSLETPVVKNEISSTSYETNFSTTRKIPDPYPCQTNVQIHPDPRCLKTKFIMDEDQYDFSHPERGYMVTIVNDRFQMQAKRDGAHWDLLKIKEISRKLGFRQFNYGKERNLTKTETLKLLRRVQQADHSSCDCFLFMISTHGLEQPNPLAKGKLDHALVCADDQLIFTSTILEMFSDENCPTLKDKPKWFIIQACRGENLDHGADVFVAFPKRTVDSTDETNVTVLDLPKEESCKPKETFRRKKKPSIDETDTKPGPGNWILYNPDPSYCVPKVPAPVSTGMPSIPRATSRFINRVYAPTPYAIVDTPSLRCDNDMLVMYAIPEGMFAWRNTSDGSWMIDYLHQVIMAYDMRKPKNLLSLLTKVSSLMAKRTTNTPSSYKLHMKKAIPVIENKLLKDIIFSQKVPVSNWMKTPG